MYIFRPGIVEIGGGFGKIVVVSCNQHDLSVRQLGE